MKERKSTAHKDLARLRELGDAIAGHRAAVEALYGEQVKLIRRASTKGASRRAVAIAAGISAARVQQIVDGDDISARWGAPNARAGV